MNMNQFTQKTTAALQRAQNLAIEYQHMQVEQEHVMLALTEDGRELIPQLLEKGFELVTVGEMLGFEPIVTSDELYVFHKEDY